MANVGIIGHGVVGSGVADILWNSREVLARRAGETIELQRVCDLRDFPAAPYADRMTKDAEQIYAADDIDIVVECMGGKGAAYRFVKAALERGKHVVTSNKELIADCGEELSASPGKRACACATRPPAAAESRSSSPSRRTGRQPHHARCGHPQRHDELHPHPHARGRRFL